MPGEREQLWVQKLEASTRAGSSANIRSSDQQYGAIACSKSSPPTCWIATHAEVIHQPNCHWNAPCHSMLSGVVRFGQFFALGCSKRRLEEYLRPRSNDTAQHAVAWRIPVAIW